jgi:hypothetical protein
MAKNKLEIFLEKHGIAFMFGIFFLLSAFTLFYYDGTADSGDSVLHYLFARYAPHHPALFLDHWAKPLFVLLASPFAQLGFVGVKIFNAVLLLLTMFLAYKSSQKLGLQNAWLTPILLFFSPLVFLLSFSGLTEPLFAFMLITSFYFLLEKKLVLAAIIISFLPFVRTEGLLFLGLIGLYFIMYKAWKQLPWLITGHLLYSIVGFFYYQDFFWVFTKIPYVLKGKIYGSGNLTHFITDLVNVMGGPIYTLFGIGSMVILIKLLRRKMSMEVILLVFVGFYAFFVAHSLFWYLGIFNSMGLNRVFISISPLFAIVALIGFNFIQNLFKNWKPLKIGIQVIIIIMIIYFPFSSNPASIKWEKDLNLNTDQQCALNVVDHIKPLKTDSTRFFFAHSYLSMALEVDYFDTQKRQVLHPDFIAEAKSGDIIIWENWFALNEGGVSQEYLDKQKNLRLIYTKSDEYKGRQILYRVYICEWK